MYIGNAMLLVLNLPLIGLWVKILEIPVSLAVPADPFLLVGASSLNNNPSEMVIMLIFGGLGYFLRKFKDPLAPVILAMVLGPMLGKSLRQSLLMSSGSGWIFLTRPISLAMILISVALLLSMVMPTMKRKREDLAKASDED